MIYAGKNIYQLSDVELVKIIVNLNNMEVEREEAAKHPKFNNDRMIDGKSVKKMEFPPLTPQYIELKQALIDEMKKRNLHA